MVASLGATSRGQRSIVWPAPPGFAGWASSHRACRFDELTFAQREKLPAHQPANPRPGQQPDHDHHVENARSQNRHRGDDDDQARKTHHRIGETLQRGIDPPAEIAGNGAEGDADDDRQARGRRGCAHPRAERPGIREVEAGQDQLTLLRLDPVEYALRIVAHAVERISR